MLGFERDGAVELVDYLVSYHKSKTYAIGVHLSWRLDKTKQFEQFVLFLQWYANSSVYDCDLQVCLNKLSLNNSCLNLNFAPLSKFEGVRL
jgi:hypothetical protein